MDLIPLQHNVITTYSIVSAQKARQQVLTTLKVVESLSYNCADATQLLHLNHMLKDVEAKFRATLPQQEGILLRPAIATHSAKKISQKYKKLHQKSLQYSSLRVHSKVHDKKRDWRFRNRVGSKALSHKKVGIITISCV